MALSCSAGDPDINQDGTVDAADINSIYGAINGLGGTVIDHDCTADGVVSFEDVRTWWAMTSTNAGDTNLDGTVTASDLISAQKQGAFDNGAISVTQAWQSGDWNGDLQFNGFDALTLFLAGAYTSNAFPHNAQSFSNICPEQVDRNAPSLLYNPTDGSLTYQSYDLDTMSIQIISQAGNLNPDATASRNGNLDIRNQNQFSHVTFGESFRELRYDNALPVGLLASDVMDDLLFDGATIDGTNLAGTINYVCANLMESEPGDFNDDRAVTSEDIDLLAAAIAQGNGDSRFDLNNDGNVNSFDHDFWIKNIANTWVGDSNLDGLFDSSDLVAIFQAGRFESGLEATWGLGDWNGDGRFDTGDLVAAFTDGGYEMGRLPF